ncbi:hypothetical protein [Thioalkalivibrio sulfidiphilus]
MPEPRGVRAGVYTVTSAPTNGPFTTSPSTVVFVVLELHPMTASATNPS